MSDNTAAQAVLTALGYEPTHRAASARLFADWRLQAGDIVTVTSGSGTSQESYTVPIYNLEMTWKGSPIVEVDTTGQKERAPLPALSRRSYGAQSATNQTLDGISARIDNQGNMIGLVVTQTAGGAVVNAASIVAGINDAGSTVQISADHIELVGSTIKVSDVLKIQNGVSFVTATGMSATWLDAETLQLRSNGAGSALNTVDPDSVSDVQIVSSGTGYKLQKKTWGNPNSWTDAGTFSRAATIAGAWSSGTYTVSATAGTVNQLSTTLYMDHSPGGAQYDNFDAIVYHDQITGGNEVLSEKVYLVDDSANSRVVARWGDSSSGTIIAAMGYSGGSHSISITRGTRSAQGPSPSNAVQIWSGNPTDVTVNNSFYSFKVTCGTAEKYYYFYVKV